METITLFIDDREVMTKKGSTLLEAAQAANIYIPALCAHPDLTSFEEVKASDGVYRGDELIKGDAPAEDFEGCRLCIVEIEGIDGFPTACTTPATSGMRVQTDTPKVQELRRQSLSAIFARHPHACLTCAQREGCPREPCSTNVPVAERCCPRLGNCELEKVAEYIGIKDDTPRWIPTQIPLLRDEPLFVRDYNLCIGCLRCVSACKELRGVDALGFVQHNNEVVVGSLAPLLKDSGCRFCTACVEVCPTGALVDKEEVKLAEREAALVPCVSTCPVGMDVPRYVHLIAEGRFDQSLAVIREKVAFPSVLGYVCFHPCENECRRVEVNEPISICTLKRFAAEQDSGLWRANSRVAPPTGKRVAIVGSGPAGLTAAYYLVRAGHSVTVFEALPEAGGMMRVGIPDYRLPPAVLNKEIEEITALGVELKMNTKIESVEKLFAEGFEAVFLAIGAHAGIKLGVEGEDIPGVIECVSFLREVNLGKEVKLGDRVTVVGGGNAAIDAARTALRLGAEEVTILYRRTQAEMPASPEEVEGALEEGVKMFFLAAPSRITRDNGRVNMECVRMELGKVDASGRRRPLPVKDGEFAIDCDTVIAAIGQTPEIPAQFGLSPGRGNTIQVDPDTLATTREGVFAGGDAVTGPASVIEAIAAGRQAAISIDKYLGGEGIIDEVLVELEEPEAWLGREEGFADKPRASMPCLPLEERIKDFAEIELGFDESLAVEEAKRCLRCDLRLQITPVISPPEKWLEFNTQNVDLVPEAEGVFQLLDEQKTTIYIKGTADLRHELEGELGTNEKACYFVYEEDPMYTSRESEHLQQFMQKYGKLPEGNDVLADLF
jgi:NADPH-dependent glutamate synthase beta subunit-like oxidoreductase